MGASKSKKRRSVVVSEKPLPAVTAVPGDKSDWLSSMGGSRFQHWNRSLVNQTLNSLDLKGLEPFERERRVRATLNVLEAINPKDELESMIAAQLVVAHTATIECFQRAVKAERYPGDRRENLDHANRLSRSFTNLLDSLGRYRGKSHHQTVTVQHVSVHAGGQAVVGVVEQGGGGGVAKETGKQPHATSEIADASFAKVRRQNPERGTVQGPGDGERPVSNARRSFNRSPSR